jgi:hypothetical protein
MMGLDSRGFGVPLHGRFGGRYMSGCVHRGRIDIITANISRGRGKFTKHGAHTVAVVLEGNEALHGERAEFTNGGHLAVFCSHRGEIKCGIVDGDVAWQTDNVRSEILAECGPELGKEINAPNIYMRGR